MNIQKNFIQCSWGRVHYTEINKSSKTTILCIHGWLDNWSSFLPLSKHLPYRIIAIDLPGHGYSDHLPEGNWYHFVDYIIRVKEIAQKLQLPEFHILGHSMGAAIGCLLASTFPGQVKSLTMIDGLGPLVNSPEDARDILRQAILKKENSKIRRRVFKDIEIAVKARLSAGSLSYESAKILVENQLNKNETGMTWSYDHKLKHTSSLRLSPSQMDSFLNKLETPSLIIAASEGYICNSPYWHKRLLIKDLSCIELDGHHHLHMDSAKECAEAIQEFLND